MNELIPIQENDKWGFANLKGEIIIAPKFIEVKSFNEDSALVCTKKVPARELYKSPFPDDIFPTETLETYKGSWDKLWGLINLNGDFLIEPNFKSIKIVSNGIAIGIKYAGPGKRWGDYCDNIYHLINFKNDNYPESAGGRYKSFSLFSNRFWFLMYGRDPVGKDYCWTNNLIVNTNGETILNISGQKITSDFENGIIKISESNKTYFYNEKGDLLAEKLVGFENISRNLNGNYFIKEQNEYFHFNIIDNISTKLNYQIDINSDIFKSEKFIQTNHSY